MENVPFYNETNLAVLLKLIFNRRDGYSFV